MRLVKKTLALFLAAGLSVSSVSECDVTSYAGDADDTFKVSSTDGWKYGIGEAMGFNENTYKSIEKAATNDNWRDGSVSANGEIAFIESCDPDEDVFIFNNTI